MERIFLLFAFLQSRHQKENNIQSKFDNFPWEKNDSYFEKWKTGRTGIPIVDAGMRQLWNTGYIHKIALE